MNRDEPPPDSRIAVVALLLGALLLLAASTAWRPSAPAAAAPNAFYGPVQGGCYLATERSCAIHIDGLQPIVVDPGTKLFGFRLSAQRTDTQAITLLYDFRTDVSNPPGDYVPSVVRGDFAAECGRSYQLLLEIRDSDDATFQLKGSTSAFVCPTAPTPTPTITPTPTTTPPPTMPPNPTATGRPPGAYRAYIPAAFR